MWVFCQYQVQEQKLNLNIIFTKKTKPAVSDAAYSQPRKLNMRSENT